MVVISIQTDKAKQLLKKGREKTRLHLVTLTRHVGSTPCASSNRPAVAHLQCRVGHCETTCGLGKEEGHDRVGGRLRVEEHAVRTLAPGPGARSQDSCSYQIESGLESHQLKGLQEPVRCHERKTSRQEGPVQLHVDVDSPWLVFWAASHRETQPNPTQLNPTQHNSTGLNNAEL